MYLDYSAFEYNFVADGTIGVIFSRKNSLLEGLNNHAFRIKLLIVNQQITNDLQAPAKRIKYNSIIQQINSI